MRDIKFRAWDKDNKKMCDVIDFSCMNYPEKYEVMQFTGLKDKNGKEIWEGDVVRTLEDGDVEVIFQHGIFGCLVERPQSNENGTEFYEEFISLNDLIDSGYWGNSDGIKQLEVIGNIYEHPELL